MNIFLFDSHSLEALAAELYVKIKADDRPLFAQTLVVIGHPLMKEWLQIELCKQSERQAIVGLQFVSWRQAVQVLSGGAFFPSRSDLATAIWQSLHTHPIAECQPFFESEKKAVDFVGHLATLFVEYSEYGLPKEVMPWQKILFERIFKAHSWLAMYQALETIPFALSTPLYLFGVDVLPPAAYHFFLRHPHPRFFRFSPCAMFWEDLRSSSEKKSILKIWQRKEISETQLQALDSLLSDVQPLLANWGKLGRKMLALSPEVDGENYELEDRPTLLTRLKLDLLLLLQEARLQPADDSIRCLRTGSSRLQEVLILQEELLKLAESGIPFADMRVYAPNIEEYAPLIEFCFTNPKKPIPFRIAGINLMQKSSFYQALIKLFSFVNGRFEADSLLSLFEMPAFYRKAGLKLEEVERIGAWVAQVGIRWGLDQAHRQEQTGSPLASQAGTWQAGFEELLDSWIFFQPTKEYSIGWSEADLFQKFTDLFGTLHKKLRSWATSRSLLKWADEIEELTDAILYAEEAEKKSLIAFTHQLRQAAETFQDALFPFSLIHSFFFSKEVSDVGGASLHSVRCAALEVGTLLPARVVYVLGMDEESFPRISSQSSLQAGMPSPVTPADLDRYLFLRMIFAAKETLIFSYGHQSPEDGKLVSPSLLLQELLGYLPNLKEETSKLPCLQSHAKISLLMSSSTAVDASIKELSLSELSRFLKNPFQAYLKQVLGISLESEVESAWEEFEFSALDRHVALRAMLSPLQEHAQREPRYPLGLFGEVAKETLHIEKAAFTEALQSWGIDPASIHTMNIQLDLRGISLSGEATLAVPDGALHMGADQIGSLLRRWAEILAILVTKGKTRIYFLKTGKIKEVANPLQALEAIVDLYTRSKKSPLFLHPDWADTILRKGLTPSFDESEDPLLQWMLSRSPAYDFTKQKEIWDPLLQTAFASLSALYPSRSKHAEV